MLCKWLLVVTMNCIGTNRMNQCQIWETEARVLFQASGIQSETLYKKAKQMRKKKKE